MRASAMNRIFGLLTHWGLRLSLKRRRAPDAMGQLEQRGVPEVWRRSIVEALAVIDLLDERITPIDQELGPLTRVDARVVLLDTVPGAGELLGADDRLRDRRRRGWGRRASSSATPVWPRRSTSPVIAAGPGAVEGGLTDAALGPPSRPPTMPGGRAILGTSFTATSLHAPARTPPSPRSRTSSCDATTKMRGSP
jgi:hypothetical protein